MTPTPEMLNSTPFKYAAQVKDGTIITGKYMQLVIDRFYKWIETTEADGYYLDHNDGMRVIDFFPKLLNHTKGTLAGQPFNLMPFQQFCLYNVFGWKNKKGMRRINKVYDKRAKKNGKTAEMAGLALFMMCLDGEIEAEVYVGATKEDQAKICWKQAKQFIDSNVANPVLRHIGFYCKQREIIYKPTYSVLMPLGGDSKTQDGINAHFSIIDEYHAHATDAVKENLESSSIQRAQPLMYQITTAGTNIASVCKAYEDVCKDILKGIIADDHTFIMIHDLDENDDWQDPTTWIKANPLLNQGLDIERIKIEFISAQNQSSKAVNFKTKHLNKWVHAPKIWIPDEIWQANQATEDLTPKFLELGCVSGTDLSTRKDITADVYVTYPDADGLQYLKAFYYCPLDSVDVRSKEDRVPYRTWVDQGYLMATPGNTVDYDYLQSHKERNQLELNVKNNEFDEWNATGIVNNLMAKDIPCSYFGQGINTISYPTKEFEKRVLEGKIIHDGNPVTRWMLANCVLYIDANENIKVHKGNSNKGGNRVDGIIAAIMAYGGTLAPEDTSKNSQYNESNETAYI